MLKNSLFSKTTTVVFIDSSVPDYTTLQNKVLEGVKTFILSPDRDGIAEITKLLQQNSQITTLHIVSHGSPESLYLGNTQLSLDNLQNYQSLITTWNVESILLHNSNSSLNTISSTSDRIAYVGLIGNRTRTNKINLSDTLVTTSTPEAGSAVQPFVNQTDIRRDEKAIVAKFSLENSVTEREITSVQPNINEGVDPFIPTTHPRILGCSCSSCARPLVDLNRINNEPQQLTAPLSAALDLSQTFFLNSLAGANHTIYLDFNGHTTSGTAWNQSYRSTNIVTPAFDLDGNPASFSSAELETIQYIWQRVAEDFIPFNVNVTTQEPTDINDLIRSGANDTRWGVRAVIGGSGLDWIGQRLSGIAYFDSFNWNTDTPTFIFSKDMAGQEKPTAETISHEVGHTLGLNHDGTISPSEEYYYGHGSGETGWAPIMGFSDFQNVTQWTKGEYRSATNTEDDLQIITTQNGFGYRTDDTGNTIATAKALNVSGTTLSGSGIIERNTDIDFYSFYTGAGAISLTVNPFTRGPNLDILAELYNSVGTLLVSSNPTESLFANIDTSVDAGTYYLKIDGVGKGDPFGTGYTDYGSLGQYFISGNIIAASITEPPVVTTTSTALSYIENATTIIDPAITVSDVDSANLASATVRITSGFVSAQDILSFTNQNGITGNYNNSTGVLTLTGAATVANYQTALRSITYTNSSDNPNTTTRTIGFSVNDGTDTSTQGTRNVTITAVNDAPVVNTTSTALSYIENATTIIDPAITVSDVDSANLASATVRITSGFVSAQDILSFTNQNGITGNYNNSTGVLTLTGAATVANYQTALRSITYTNSSDNPNTTTRTIGFSVNDGTDTSTQGTRNVTITAVNDAPVVNTTSTALSYIENATTIIDPAITVTDVDSPNLASATVRITSGFVSAQDILSFTNQNGITGNYNNSTGVLTLTGAATVANYQTALRSITYTNSSDNPNTTPRTISFQVNDGSLNSTTVNRNININNQDNVVTGTANNENFTTTAQKDIINAQGGNDTITSTFENLQQNDSLNGGTGIDTLIITGGTSANAITINSNNANQFNIPGTTIIGFERFDLSGFTGKIRFIGNSGDDWIHAGAGNDNLTGGNGNDYLNGGTGADTMIGGAGNDFYYVDNVGDKITENFGQGIDTVFSTISYTLGNNLENLTLEGTSAINGTGNSLNNILIGNSGNNVLNGRAGADTMIGGEGNDSYYVDNVRDVIVENANQGTDTVFSTISYTLGNNLENLTLQGSSAINVTGNDLNNILTGNSRNNVLNGQAGADTMIGGAGNDSYYVDNVGDTIVENANQGTDTVFSTISYTLGNHLENLTLQGTSAINGTGNDLNNILTGNAAANILIGGAGADTLIGNAGADTFIGGTGNDKLYLGLNDGAVDIVNYALNDGADTVYQFVRGVGGDQIQFTGITNIDVVRSFSNTLLRLGDGIAGNSRFGTGQLLVTLSGTSGFIGADVNVNLFGANFLFT
ncbi:DUF4347 domain-containing protein [Nodularia sphaerocarpa]|uniref:DUF4347 domain-containing protein n=2 Tax=Nodularia sphaerocarpa TaxID=137816 RepID=UPI001EFB57DE|nr:DUF4347 domain-containing protein [Nodularia sphaerocarpa]ULP70924.1 Bifunctional hemolysin/adenylate cyclase [Nodularia sphaerocarpa UHCC 0038]